jgi:hypothetical protein
MQPLWFVRVGSTTTSWWGRRRCSNDGGGKPLTPAHPHTRSAHTGSVVSVGVRFTALLAYGRVRRWRAGAPCPYYSCWGEGLHTKSQPHALGAEVSWLLSTMRSGCHERRRTGRRPSVNHRSTRAWASVTRVVLKTSAWLKVERWQQEGPALFASGVQS